MEDPNQATDWLLQLISVVPTDPHVLAKLGKLYDNEGDKSQAFHYYYEVLALYCFSNALCHNLKKIAIGSYIKQLIHLNFLKCHKRKKFGGRVDKI